MGSPRQYKEPSGSRPSIGFAVAGVIVAGLGLLSMRQAFPPLPKPETPVVLARAGQPVAAVARVDAAAPAAAMRPDELTEDAPVRASRTSSSHVRALARLDAAQPAPAGPSAPPNAAPAKTALATGSDDEGKLCKAPAPEDAASKILRRGLMLRDFDRSKASAIDIAPSPPPPEDERRLTLSSLFAHILEN